MRFNTFLFFVILISTCKLSFAKDKMGSIQFNIVEPGEVIFASTIKNFVLLDRSSYKPCYIPSEVDTANLSCLNGLRETLLATNHYSVSFAKTNYVFNERDPKFEAPPLDWESVAKLVNYDTTTELIVLERKFKIKFDYEYQCAYGYLPGNSYKNATGEIFHNNYERTFPFFQSDTKPFIASFKVPGFHFFWRIYDLRTKTVIDDFEERTDNVFFPSPGQGKSLDKLDAFYSEGVTYAHHLLPFWYSVFRHYYIDGSTQMKQASSFAITRNLNEAINLWKTETTNENIKVKRKALYNYALGCEIYGELDSALIYVQKSKDLGDSYAPFYITKLKKRIGVMQLIAEEINLGEGIIPEMQYFTKRY